jgi:beta-lactam-binding protein with PASTA domain
MGFFNFLISKTFFKHLAIAVVVAVVVFWAILKILGIYTSHGESLAVPDLTGVNYNDIDRIEGAGQFEYLLIDSVYDDHFQKGAIVLQDPPPGSKVKHGRKIYVTVVATQPEMVFVPDLVDLSLRQALSELKASGLKLEKMEYVENFAKNAVLAQRYQGDTIRPGMEIQKGSAIELVLGKGLKDDKIKVPFLIGKTESEAISILNNLSFNVGFLKYLDERDRAHSRVYNQQPEARDNYSVEFGTYIDLWFRSDIEFDFDSLLLVYAADTLGADSLIVKPLKLQD